MFKYVQKCYAQNRYVQKTVAPLCAGLISGLLAVSFSSSSQAATFRFTVEGLEGSGIITVDDAALTGIGTEAIDIEDLAGNPFVWSFVIGQGSDVTVIQDLETDDIVDIIETPFPVTLESSRSTAAGGVFIFQDGELVDIDDYDWLFAEGDLNGKGGEESELVVDNGFVSVFSAGESGADFDFDEFGGVFITSFSEWNITRRNLPYQLTTIVPFQGQNQSVPEPSLMAGLVPLGIGLLLRRTKA
ncbi:MAG: hypothetical protein HC825_06025 [Oscillatoriales cyanobacterium RM1_1_9]|nr:hypothetical protein [Oscillatoriales cyanobacterium SM2_3_0]NJO46660.1 hypothetical protein [Oscillatoriales cyanobacterium RM2_1_1]NJO71357.1 hypothetical protein [Oscillatoriales cyanobacterium RM1_1_9]